MDGPADASESLLGKPMGIPEETTEHELFPQVRQWLWAFLALGILERSVRYFAALPLVGR